MEYPKLELIVCKRGRVKPKDDSDAGSPDELLAYITGEEASLPCISLRLNNLKKGDYYVMYRPDFKKDHLVKRLNIVLYSEFQKKKSDKELQRWKKQMDKVQNQAKARISTVSVPDQQNPDNEMEFNNGQRLGVNQSQNLAKIDA